jgi:hypothetical protein
MIILEFGATASIPVIIISGFLFFASLPFAAACITEGRRSQFAVRTIISMMRTFEEKAWSRKEKNNVFENGKE